MSQPTSKLARVTAGLVTATGVLFFMTYLVYLPFPSLFDFSAAGQGMAQQSGILFYCLATAGAAFVAWGLMLGGLRGEGVSRQHVLNASAAGLGLLALMRLGTATFPHAPFDQLRWLPLVECVIFTLVAVRLYRS